MFESFRAPRLQLVTNATRIGNLHGAIDGNDLSGFIGATYQAFPFPTDPADFKQSTNGDTTQAEVGDMVSRFGLAEQIVVNIDPKSGHFSLNQYVFDGPGFEQLVAYVARGGYPQWKNGQAPHYVEQMVGTFSAAQNAWGQT